MKKLQGDIIIRSVDKIPKRAKKVKRGGSGSILHLGEVTGHAHRIDEEVELYEYNDAKYLKAYKPVEIKHEEHKPLTIPPGIYIIERALQYDHFQRDSSYLLD